MDHDSPENVSFAVFFLAKIVEFLIDLLNLFSYIFYSFFYGFFFFLQIGERLDSAFFSHGVVDLLISVHYCWF